MANKKDFYQVGICPNCSGQTRQQFLFATNDYAQPPATPPSQYMVVRTWSLFRCEGCRSLSLYETKLEHAQFLPTGKRNEWLVDLRSYVFSDQCKLIYSTPALNYFKVFFELLDVDYSDPEQVHPTMKARTDRESPNLDPATPETVRQCHEIGIAVRPISLDLYALQLRKTLEAVCKDVGASECLENGRRAMLWQQIEELGRRNLVGEFICKAAQELKDISNTGAHYSEDEVTHADIRKLEHLLALITMYVYGEKKSAALTPKGQFYENFNP
jgi:hypothetical protein